MKFMEMCRYTEDQAKRVSVVGWVKNTPYGTVTGQVQGSKEKVDIMKDWLSNVGSPMSRIDKAVFSNERQIQDLGHSNFQTKY
ncbi:acylphosphatase-2-like isoform X1 [Phyllobates terribilis]|uniref:acylphosphatase-2-like isoform X1 n=1 Tax=Phyllobates terribilis TaxID=111132 RepID=UPI003CCB281F